MAVQAYGHILHAEITQLHERVEALAARLTQNSTTSHRPPSSDSPHKKPRQRTTTTPRRKVGGKWGHPDHLQVLMAPTILQELRPARCACGNTTFALTTPYDTHQMLELPPIALDVTHWVLHQCAITGGNPDTRGEEVVRTIRQGGWPYGPRYQYAKFHRCRSQGPNSRPRKRRLTADTLRSQDTGRTTTSSPTRSFIRMKSAARLTGASSVAACFQSRSYPGLAQPT